MITLLLFFLAGILNAFMDTIEEGHFSNSIFSNWDPKFWYKWQSWKYVRRIKLTIKKTVILDYPLDAWHIAKSLWWVSVLLAPVTYIKAGPIFPHWVLDVSFFWGVSMLTFGLFYNHIFKKP